MQKFILTLAFCILHSAFFLCQSAANSASGDDLSHVPFVVRVGSTTNGTHQLTDAVPRYSTKAVPRLIDCSTSSVEVGNDAD
jgi:hypothetical protein